MSRPGSVVHSRVLKAPLISQKSSQSHPLLMFQRCWSVNCSPFRCQYLSPRFLTEQMKNCRLLKKAPACREYLAKIFKVSHLILYFFMIFPSYYIESHVVYLYGTVFRTVLEIYWRNVCNTMIHISKSVCQKMGLFWSLRILSSWIYNVL